MGLENGDMTRFEYILKVKPVGFSGEYKVGSEKREESRVTQKALSENLEEWDCHY